MFGGWCVVIILVVIVVYGFYKFVKILNVFFIKFENIMYGIFSRFVWGLVLVWLVYVCYRRFGGM